MWGTQLTLILFLAWWNTAEHNLTLVHFVHLEKHKKEHFHVNIWTVFTCSLGKAVGAPGETCWAGLENMLAALKTSALPLSMPYSALRSTDQEPT